MDDLDNSPADTHLSYPVASGSQDPAPPPVPQSRQLLKDRLFVGNLSPTVDEYTLLQVFSKYGKVSKLDFLFHKAGPQKGKPRGYAFVEYSNENDAIKALASANDKLLRGRKLVVTYAQQAPMDLTSAPQGRTKRHMNDMGKPTTLSLIKSIGNGRSDATGDKIAKMEAKLRQMEHSPSSGSAISHHHPSLPSKPLGATHATTMAMTNPTRMNARKSAPSLPPLPLAQPPAAAARSSTSMSKPGGPSVAPSSRKVAPLTGVKIKKPKDAL